MTKFRTTIGVFVVGTALFATGCGDDSSSTADESTTTTAAEAAAIKVEGQWARTSPANAEHGAAYMMITATDDDMLTSASVDASVAAKVEIHETVPADGATGMTGVMLLDLAEPLKAGDTIEVTLTFEKADPMTIKVPVRDDAP